MEMDGRLEEQTGGAGAAEHAISTFGGIGEQKALAGSNVIAMKGGRKGKSFFGSKRRGGGRKTGKLFFGSKRRGGTRKCSVKSSEKKKGGEIITELAVPALLLLANNAYKPKPKK